MKKMDSDLGGIYCVAAPSQKRKAPPSATKSKRATPRKSKMTLEDARRAAQEEVAKRTQERANTLTNSAQKKK
jgi:hypothetical protein